MYEFGTIVLVPFPFTDLSSAKVRPALIVTRDDHPGDDIILCFITSRIEEGNPVQLLIDADKSTGLKIRSSVRLDKIATLEKKIVLGELGRVDRSLLQKHGKKFHQVFGFE